MKARIYETISGGIRVEYDNPTGLFHDPDYPIGSRISRYFRAYHGYVYEMPIAGRDTRQVCEALTHRGSTLHAPKDGNLLNLIRREWRRRHQQERKFFQNYD